MVAFVHGAQVVLGVGMVLRCRQFVKTHRLGKVLLGAAAVFKQRTQSALRRCEPLGCCQLVPVQRLRKVFILAQPFFKQDPQAVLRRRAALVRRLFVAALCLRVALRHALSFLEHQTQIELRDSLSQGCGRAAFGHLDFNGCSNFFLLL